MDSILEVLERIEDSARQFGAITGFVITQKTTAPTQSAGGTLRRGLLNQIQNGSGNLRPASARNQPAPAQNQPVQQKRGGFEGIFDQTEGLLQAAEKFRGAIAETTIRPSPHLMVLIGVMKAQAPLKYGVHRLYWVAAQ